MPITLLTDQERGAQMVDMRPSDGQMPCVIIFRHDSADKGVDLGADIDILKGFLPMGGLGRTAARMVRAHGNVPLKPHGKAFLREVPGRMRRHRCDERPPRPALRAAPFSVDPKRVREGIIAGETSKGKCSVIK